jgi:hypothetical protein
MASQNWEYLTEEQANGPRKDEQVYSTTNAKSLFRLDTADIAKVTGYRRSHGHWGGGNTLTLYYHGDLEEAAIKKYGKVSYDEYTAAQKLKAEKRAAKYEKERKEQIAAAEKYKLQAAAQEAMRVKMEKEAAIRAEM